MKRISSFLAAVFVMTALSSPALAVTEEWVRPFGGLYSNAKSVAVDSTEGVYVTGDEYDPTWGRRSITKKYNSNGNEVWQGDAGGKKVIVDSADYIYAVGYYDLAKFDKDGNVLWKNVLPGYPYDAIALDGNGYAYVFGRCKVAKFAPDGVVEWYKELYYSGYNGGYAGGVVDATGNVYTMCNGYVVGMDTNGNELWADLSEVTGSYLAQYQYNMALDSKGNVYQSGWGSDNSGSFGYVVKYSGSGTFKWARKDQQSNNEGLNLITVDRYDNVYVSQSVYYNNNMAIHLIKYDARGNLIWDRFFENLYNDCKPLDTMKIDSSGNLYLAVGNLGSTNGYVTMKIDPNGNTLWRMEYNAGNSYSTPSSPNAIAIIDSSNNVYVTGYVTGNVNYQGNLGTTVKYSQPEKVRK